MSCLFGQSSHIGQSAHIFGQVGANSSVCSHVWTGLRGFDLRPKLDAWAERRLQACISAEQPAQVDFTLKWGRDFKQYKVVYLLHCLFTACSIAQYGVSSSSGGLFARFGCFAIFERSVGHKDGTSAFICFHSNIAWNFIIQLFCSFLCTARTAALNIRKQV